MHIRSQMSLTATEQPLISRHRGERGSLFCAAANAPQLLLVVLALVLVQRSAGMTAALLR